MGKRKDNDNNNNEGLCIKCNVSTCAHNCIEDCTCLLREIKVARCTCDECGDADKDTACHSYKYMGIENTHRGNI